jgi:DNA (cytosine-5)-methyltransferase 1
MKFNYEWKLSDGYPAPGVEKHGLKVFSCFACGGGSTMGYKLAGYDVIGFNEIDPKMAECYIANHNPKFRYIEPIQDFKNRDDLPEELFNLDILDGSPPCSSFSMAGNREKDWGKKKKFREGQQEQVLDTLFFDFLDVAEKLQPKVILAENVKGLLLGNAANFLGAVMRRFKAIGYSAAYRLLDASKMGVPQRRQRVFIYAVRSDLLKHLETCDLFGFEPSLDLDFVERVIRFDEIYEIGNKERLLTGEALRLWGDRTENDIDLENVSRREGRPNFMFNHKFIKQNKVSNTITGNDNCCLYVEPRYRSKKELCKCGSYPSDYEFKTNKPEYLIGMSVPPVMTAQIAHRIKEQWFDKF